MTLKQRHENKSDYDLLYIMEHAEGYTPEAIEVISEILGERAIDSDDLKAMALEINVAKVKKQLKDFDPINDEIVIHQSRYLDDATIKSIYKELFDQMIQEREGYRFDVFWKYAIGGI